MKRAVLVGSVLVAFAVSSRAEMPNFDALIKNLRSGVQNVPAPVPTPIADPATMEDADSEIVRKFLVSIDQLSAGDKNKRIEEYFEMNRAKLSWIQVGMLLDGLQKLTKYNTPDTHHTGFATFLTILTYDKDVVRARILSAYNQRNGLQSAASNVPAPAARGIGSAPGLNMRSQESGIVDFSAKVVVPELTWDWWVKDPRSIPGYVALQIKVGGFLGIGGMATTGPMIFVGRDVYGEGGPELRIGADGTLYLAFDTRPDAELYCCLGSLNPRQGENGVWYGEFGQMDNAQIMDIGKKGFYVVGKLVNVKLESLRHGATLRMNQIQFAPGMRLAASRRIMRGDRAITLESLQAPTMAEGTPSLIADRSAVDEALARRR